MTHPLASGTDWFRVLYEDNPASYGILAPDGTVLSVNRFGASNLGYAPDELVGAPFTMVLHPDDQVEAVAQLRACVADPGGPPHVWTMRKLRRDGADMWVRATARSLTAADGRVLVLIGCEDVSAVRQSEERLRQLAENVREVIWITDPILEKLWYISPAYERIWGRTRASLYADPRSWLEASVHPDDRDRVRNALADAIKRTGAFDQTYRIIRPDGSMRWVTDHGNLVRGPDGTPLRFVGIADDITERVEAEQQLRLLDSAVREAMDAVMITAVDGDVDQRRIVFVNPAFTRMTGWAADEIRDQSPTVLLGPRSDVATVERLRGLLRRGQAFAGELVCYRRDGTALDLAWSVAPVHSPNGAITHFVAILSDITARRHAAEELRQAKAMAEAADHAKSAFLAAMSHELRTPLTAIIGFSELLEDLTGGPLTERQRKYVANILSSGRSLLDLIDQVLDIARVEVGRLTLTLTPVDVGELLDDVTMLVRPLAAKRDITLSLSVADGLPKITADAPKVKQVIFSILANAIRHTPDGGRIDISAQPVPSVAAREGAGGVVEICVQDTGPGIRPDDRERVLNDFGLAEAARSATGTGMSLALARKLVELHGGQLWLEGEEGVGTRVKFVLPKAARVAGPRRSPIEPTPEGTPPDAPLVLVIEDDPQASDLLAHYMEEGGYAVAQAYTAAQGLEMARRLDPHAITLDPALPDRDGLDMLQDLRATRRLTDVPVIVVSVSAPRTDAERLGATSWIVKPVNRVDLMRVLRRHGGSPGARRDVPAGT